MTTQTDTPRVYVGTYAKYNNGSLQGAWMDLEGHDAGSFHAACLELHKDEADPELMFQDFESFPREYYGESHLDSRLWDWLDLSDHERELLAVYVENVNQDGTLEEARDAYAGTYESEESWAEDFLEQSGELNQIPERLRYYFDFAAYARDAGMDSVCFVQHDGQTWVFWR